MVRSRLALVFGSALAAALGACEPIEPVDHTGTTTSDDGHSADDGRRGSPDPTPDAPSSCRLMADGSRQLFTQPVAFAVESSGTHCSLRIDGGPARAVPCKGTATVAARSLAVGQHTVELVVDDDHTCAADIDVAYPGPCSVDLDFGLNGHVDGRQTWVYNPDGTLHQLQTDNPLDGDLDTIATYVRSAGGRLEEVELDTPVGGGIDERQTYDYDVSGRRIRRRDDRNADGIPETVGTYVYDARGNIRHRLDDLGGDGNIDVKYTRLYTPDGDYIGRVRDIGNDGVIDSSWTMVRHPDGHKLLQYHDADADGTYDLVSRFDYSCW